MIGTALTHLGRRGAALPVVVVGSDTSKMKLLKVRASVCGRQLGLSEFENRGLAVVIVT